MHLPFQNKSIPHLTETWECSLALYFSTFKGTMLSVPPVVLKVVQSMTLLPIFKISLIVESLLYETKPQFLRITAFQDY